MKPAVQCKDMERMVCAYASLPFAIDKEKALHDHPECWEEMNSGQGMYQQESGLQASAFVYWNGKVTVHAHSRAVIESYLPVIENKMGKWRKDRSREITRTTHRQTARKSLGSKCKAALQRWAAAEQERRQEPAGRTLLPDHTYVGPTTNRMIWDEVIGCDEIVETRIKNMTSNSVGGDITVNMQ